jgi:hypothetical protein
MILPLNPHSLNTLPVELPLIYISDENTADVVVLGLEKNLFSPRHLRNQKKTFQNGGFNY